MNFRQSANRCIVLITDAPFHEYNDGSGRTMYTARSITTLLNRFDIRTFAIVQPTTKTRVDVGIQLKDAAPAAARLQAGGFSGMVSHKVAVTSVAEVDDELAGWLRQAYERA